MFEGYAKLMPRGLLVLEVKRSCNTDISVFVRSRVKPLAMRDHPTLGPVAWQPQEVRCKCLRA
jgi:hypothetical protein